MAFEAPLNVFYDRALDVYLAGAVAVGLVRSPGTGGRRRCHWIWTDGTESYLVTGGRCLMTSLVSRRPPRRRAPMLWGTVSG